MTKLKKFYAQNCTSLTGTVDLSMCQDLLQVDTSGTAVSIVAPNNTSLTKYEVGTPTSINLINPTVLTVAEVKVDNCSSLNSLDITNIPNNKSFSMFEKIMNTL